ncbi:response regulator [Halomarina litorea]|uniref:response regulator n=1 Tax=Halomarina litorea TaxID=2961595 RepID=UPI0020C2D9A1|nr:response regulator [Halomarina sp. BCD28]
MTDDRPVVLVVEDEPPLVEIYSRWLEADHEVRSATSGEAALSTLDDDVDLVLLDRMMPEMSGDEVLAELRRRGFDTLVMMVTAVEPGLDIIEAGVDAYLTKPLERDLLLSAVDRLLDRRNYSALEREFYRLVSKRAVLENTTADQEPDGEGRYADLERRIETVRREMDRQVLDSDEDFVALVREIERGGDQ